MTIEQLQQYRAQGYRLVPVMRTYENILLNPAQIYEKLGWQSEHHFLLESGKIGEYSFLGGEPFAKLIAKNGQAVFESEAGREELSGNPLERLREKMALYRAPRLPGLPKFRGGAVGFLSYDMARYFERLPEHTRDDLGTPDLYFVFVDKLCVIDHRQGLVHLIAHVDVEANAGLEAEMMRCEQALDAMERNLLSGESRVAEFAALEAQEDWEISFSQEAFCAAVEQVQEYIRQGDVFQVNLAVRQGRTLGAAPYVIYRHLREVNPSPY
ncbi:MAG: chorismate-binding protein, partial [Tumebacillaceae bacterium]